MALITCPECGRAKVSDTAMACPDCGFAIKEHFDIERDKKEFEEYKADKPIYYCPICGYDVGFRSYNICEYKNHPTTCRCCGTELIPDERGYLYFCCLRSGYKSYHTQYYGTKYSPSEIMRMENVYNNPQYNPELGKQREELCAQEDIHAENDKRMYGLDANKNAPKCPICNSINLSKISTASKAGKIALFGIFGMGDNGKTWKCNSCGAKF